MKHTRWITWVLVLVLALGLLPMAAFASDLKLPEPFGSQALTTRVNPLYQDVLKPEDLGLDNRPGRPPADAQPMATNYVTIAQAAVQMRQQMKNRATSFTLYIASDSTDYEAIIEEVLLQALVHTGKPKEGDYLMWHYAGFGGSVERASSGGQYRYTYNLEMAYYTTAAQESQLDTAVSNLLRSLNLSGKSNYQKVKAVYDYICKNVTYDEANLNNDSYTLKFSAYAALVNKTAVCQGYASLFYRLMLELGIDARVISGDGGGPHGWNIVKLGNVYYNVDTTWDAGMTEYQFFLRDTENFLGHARYLEYMSTQFHTDYPMAEDDYVDGVAGVPEHYFVMGTCGDDAYWAVSRDRQLTVVGEGETYNVSDSGDLEDLSPWAFWTDGFESVLIDDGITTIGSNLFYNMDNMVEISLPDSLIKIGDGALRGCSYLAHIDLPESLKEIGQNALAGCVKISAIELPSGLEKIGKQAFSGTPLIRLVIPDSVTTIDNEAFCRNTALIEVTLGSGLENAGSYIFSRCTSLRKVTLKEGLTILGDYMFERCESLTEIAFPSTLESIGGEAFTRTGLREVVIPDSVTQIGTRAFYQCTQLLSVTLGTGKTTLGNAEFESSAVRYVSMPDTITYIGWNAFLGCPIEHIDLSDSLITIGDGAFGGTRLKEIELPEGLERIDSFAFKGCKNLTEVTIPSTVTYLGGFQGCSNLKKVIFADSAVEIIAAYAFDSCSSLESFLIPASVKSIHSSAFSNCTSLKEMIVPETVTGLPSGFSGCSGLETVYINYNGELTQYYLSGCSSLKNVYLSDNITAIGHQAFAGDTALERLSIPGSVRSIGDNLFGYGGTSNLKEIVFLGEAPTFNESTFHLVTATAYYPEADPSWTEEVRQNYGGTITWVPMHEHTYTTVISEPECAKPGYATCTCTDCSFSYVTDIVDPFGHVFGDWSITQQPGCVEPGEEQRICSRCGGAETRQIKTLGHNYVDGFCTRCGKEKPLLEGVLRIAGADRIETSLMLVDQLKEVLGVEKFNAVIVSSALNFPDALTGSYLAAVKDAPILLTYDMSHEKVLAYIGDNLAPGGTVYILGGESAVSAAFENMAKAAGLNTKRVAGSDRFATNLAIMEEAGIRADQPILIATAVNFADSLSASAAGLPMVLVHGSLRDDQKAFLNTTSGEFIIIGGTAAVSEELEAELAAIGTVERLAGDSRYQTSVLVAQKFLAAPEAVILAYARNFPDGLCGGPVAYALGAPLILTDNILPLEADAYVDGMEAGIVVGGGGLISDETAREIFELAVDMPIE